MICGEAEGEGASQK